QAVTSPGETPPRRRVLGPTRGGHVAAGMLEAGSTAHGGLPAGPRARPPSRDDYRGHRTSPQGTPARFEAEGEGPPPPRRNPAEAIAQVVWDQDVESWWKWEGDELIFAPSRKVELRLPSDHDRKVAKAAEEFLEDLKKEELAASVRSYVDRVTDDRADGFAIF